MSFLKDLIYFLKNFIGSLKDLIGFLDDCIGLLMFSTFISGFNEFPEGPP
jgi:hypothetical protein